MNSALPLLTICGLADLPLHRDRGVSDVLSLLDPGEPDPPVFDAYGRHRRETLRFHDAIDPIDGLVLPSEADIRRIIGFGHAAAKEEDGGRHFLIHCHYGVSRSTAAMATILAAGIPQASGGDIMSTVASIRPQAWPNSRMIAFADSLLGREGELIDALRRLYGRQVAADAPVVETMRLLNRGREIDSAIL